LAIRTQLGALAQQRFCSDAQFRQQESQGYSIADVEGV
jgi:hypothetical protein